MREAALASREAACAAREQALQHRQWACDEADERRAAREEMRAATEREILELHKKLDAAEAARRNAEMQVRVGQFHRSPRTADGSRGAEVAEIKAPATSLNDPLESPQNSPRGDAGAQAERAREASVTPSAAAPATTAAASAAATLMSSAAGTPMAKAAATPAPAPASGRGARFVRAATPSAKLQQEAQALLRRGATGDTPWLGGVGVRGGSAEARRARRGAEAVLSILQHACNCVRSGCARAEPTFLLTMLSEARTNRTTGPRRSALSSRGSGREIRPGWGGKSVL
eukprot:4777205-Pleurochrysis_carterae.AAC.6